MPGWTLLCVPAAQKVMGDDGTWMNPASSTLDELDRLVRDVQPMPASKLDRCPSRCRPPLRAAGRRAGRRPTMAGSRRSSGCSSRSGWWGSQRGRAACGVRGGAAEAGRRRPDSGCGRGAPAGGMNGGDDPGHRRRSRRPRAHGGRPGLRDARRAPSDRRVPHGLRDLRPGGGCRGRRAGGVHQGACRDGALPARRAVPAVAADDRRQRGAQPPAVAGPPEALAVRVAAEPAAPVPLPEAAALAGDDRRELASALARLGPEHREVIALRYLLDLSEAECAAALTAAPDREVAALAGARAAARGAGGDRCLTARVPVARARRRRGLAADARPRGGGRRRAAPRRRARGRARRRAAARRGSRRRDRRARAPPGRRRVAFPGARDDVLEWLGLRNVEVRRVPAPPPGARPEREDDLGRVVTLAPRSARRASRRASPMPLAPPTASADRSPDLARLRASPRPPSARRLPRRAVLTQARGGIRGEYLQKMLLGGTQAEGWRSAATPASSSRAARTSTSTRPRRHGEGGPSAVRRPTLVWIGGGHIFRLELNATPRKSAGNRAIRHSLRACFARALKKSRRKGTGPLGGCELPMWQGLLRR